MANQRAVHQMKKSRGINNQPPSWDFSPGSNSRSINLFNPECIKRYEELEPKKGAESDLNSPAFNLRSLFRTICRLPKV